MGPFCKFWSALAGKRIILLFLSNILAFFSLCYCFVGKKICSDSVKQGAFAPHTSILLGRTQGIYGYSEKTRCYFEDDFDIA